MSTSPTHFQQLLRTALAQAQPQRLLFVFAGAELPPDASAEQRRRYEAGEGGALEPLACVDKGPAELASFEALVAESRAACPPWQVVFVGALSGRDGLPPPPAQVEEALRRMVEAIRTGRLAGYLALDPAGDPLTFS